MGPGLPWETRRGNPRNGTGSADAKIPAPKGILLDLADLNMQAWLPKGGISHRVPLSARLLTRRRDLNQTHRNLIVFLLPVYCYGRCRPVLHFKNFAKVEANFSNPAMSFVPAKILV